MSLAEISSLVLVEWARAAERLVWAVFGDPATMYMEIDHEDDGVCCYIKVFLSLCTVEMAQQKLHDLDELWDKVAPDWAKEFFLFHLEFDEEVKP